NDPKWIKRFYDRYMDAVIYTRKGCEASQVVRDHLRTLGIESRMRAVDRDATARREWEDLDGQVTPLLVIDQRQIVRGLDRARAASLRLSGTDSSRRVTLFAGPAWSAPRSRSSPTGRSWSSSTRRPWTTRSGRSRWWSRSWARPSPSSRPSSRRSRSPTT